MALRSGRIVIFLILGVSLIWPASGKTSGNSSKKEDSSKVTLSKGINSNPYLQPEIHFSAENNPYFHNSDNTNQLGNALLHLPDNKQQSGNALLHLPDDKHQSGNAFLYTSDENQSGDPNTSQKHEDTVSISVTSLNYNNPFFVVSTNQRVEPVTQAPNHAPELTTSTPYTSSPPTTDSSHLITFPIKVEPPISSSLPLLSPIGSQIGQEKPRSELKCDEYVREIAGTTEIMPLVGTSSGVIKVNNVCQNTNKLVLGGTEARNGEFPHMVALGKYNSDETFILMCGGTLISHTWVLSAAHCTYGPNGSPSIARVGYHRLTDRQFGVTVSIKNMTRHPNYAPPAMYADIALIELASAVTFSDLIRPACLYQQYDTVPASAWVSGWGVTEYAGDQTDRLQKAQLNLIDNLACTIRHNSSREVPYGVTPSMICAGDPYGGWTKDTCQGDSGGPLQVIHPKNLCLFQVIGITSFGQGCATFNMPGVYIRVSHYISWIENIVWPQDQ